MPSTTRAGVASTVCRLCEARSVLAASARALQYRTHRDTSSLHTLALSASSAAPTRWLSRADTESLFTTTRWRDLHRGISSVPAPQDFTSQSNNELHPSGVDSSVFEDISEEYQQLGQQALTVASSSSTTLASSSADPGSSLAREAFFSAYSAKNYSANVLVSALSDPSISTKAGRLDKAYSLFLELENLETSITHHMAFAHAAVEAANDAIVLSRLEDGSANLADVAQGKAKAAAITSDSAEVRRDERLRQVLTWLTLSPSRYCLDKTEKAAQQAALREAAFAVRKAAHLVLRAMHAPRNEAERHLVCQIAAVLVQKGYARREILQRLLARAFLLPGDLWTGLTVQDQREWIAWQTSVLRELHSLAVKEVKAHPTCKSFRRTLADLDTIFLELKKKEGLFAKPSGALWLKMLQGTPFSAARKWQQHALFGDTSCALSKRMFALAFAGSNGTASTEDSMEDLLTQETSRKIEHRYPGAHETYQMLSILVDQAAQHGGVARVQALYELWIGNLRKLMDQSNALQDASAVVTSSQVPNAEVTISLPPQGITAKRAELMRRSTQSAGFELFVLAYVHLHQSSSDAINKADLPSPAKLAAGVLQDMLSLGLFPQEREWSMILLAWIAEGRSAMTTVKQIARALQVVDRHPSMYADAREEHTGRMTEYLQGCLTRASEKSATRAESATTTDKSQHDDSTIVLSALLHSYKVQGSRFPRASITTRMAALDACARAKKEEGAPLRSFARRIFSAVWDEVVQVEGIQETDRDAALTDFWKQVEIKYETLVDEQGLSGAASMSPDERKKRRLEAKAEGSAPLTRAFLLRTPHSVKALRHHHELIKRPRIRGESIADASSRELSQDTILSSTEDSVRMEDHSVYARYATV